ncbi:hypothetical protein [uncultured Pelagimonas sp.]|uniref:hypothetical protein n=1 Tax=uncultured Pelagimonas sp. TaxID=1618102 RepID=UPI002611E432|nr:hypothetical protein [uncultured Pelagimonas sp.]
MGKKGSAGAGEREIGQDCVTPPLVLSKWRWIRAVLTRKARIDIKMPQNSDELIKIQGNNVALSGRLDQRNEVKRKGPRKPEAFPNLKSKMD